MSVPIPRRLARRSRRASMALAALLGTSVSAASADPARFAVQAAITPSTSASSGASFDLRATLAQPPTSASGRGYELRAQLEASPSGCSGDTIFANGFEP